MAIQHMGVDEARERKSLRMVVGGCRVLGANPPRASCTIEGIECAAVRLVYDSEAFKEWAGQRSGPVAIYDNEPPRSESNYAFDLSEVFT